MPAYHAEATSRPRQPAVPPNSLILVTGGTGFIGSHVVHSLLSHPNKYRVRAPVRSEEKAKGLVAYVEEHFGKGRLETPFVKDMAAKGAYDGVIDKDVSGVVHVAADVSFGDTWQVVEATQAGLEELLSTIAKVPSVKRLVLTSSSVACGQPDPLPRSQFNPSKPTQVFDHDTWDDDMPKFARQQADNQRDGKEVDKTPGKLNMAMYATGKIMAERSAWQWLSHDDKKELHNLTFTTVHPNATLGEPILKGGAASVPGEWVWSLYAGDTGTYETALPQWFNNVRDVAEAHVAAIARDDVGNERILAFSGMFGWSDVPRTLIKAYPEKKGTIAKPQEGDKDTVDGTEVKNQRFKELCGGKLIGFEDSVKQTIDGLIKSGAKQDVKA